MANQNQAGLIGQSKSEATRSEETSASSIDVPLALEPKLKRLIQNFGLPAVLEQLAQYADARSVRATPRDWSETPEVAAWNGISERSRAAAVIAHTARVQP